MGTGEIRGTYGGKIFFSIVINSRVWRYEFIITDYAKYYDYREVSGYITITINHTTTTTINTTATYIRYHISRERDCNFMVERRYP